MADENDMESVSEEDAGEDVPSNFFDDFEKDEFLKGLEVVDSVPNDDEYNSRERGASQRRHRSTSSSRLDDYIKPGSRRDPEKTNAAILRDKEVKVKEHLAKHLESHDDLRPPGTELDDFFDEARPSKVRKKDQQDLRNESETERRKESPTPQPHWSGPRGNWRGAHSGTRHNYYPRNAHRYSPGRQSPRRSPKFVIRRSPHYRSRRSPWNSPKRSSRRSPRRSPRDSPRRGSRHCPRFSPGRSLRRSPKRSPHRSSRRSPQHTSIPHGSRHSQQRDARSSSPSSRKRLRSNQSPHWSPRRSPQHVSSKNDHYSKKPSPPRYNSQFSQPHYNPEVPGMSSQYGYAFTETYNPYSVQPGPPEMPLHPAPPGFDMPQPVPMPINPVPASMMTPNLPHMNYMAPEPVPMIPAPEMLPPAIPQSPYPSQFDHAAEAPHDALAQLVADGQLSKEDYLKLTPSIKGGTSSLLDEKTRVTVLTRCNQAANKLNNLSNPFRFLIENEKCSTELLSLPQKYASPLKRQVTVEFEFTKPANQIQNKQLINNILASIGLEKEFVRTKVSKDVKSVGVQTTKPYCDMCEIRESTKKCSAGVSTDPLFLMNTVHTQVVEQDLLNSRAVFNPTGSVGDGAPISIAHLTPAQLVSQLAARAKTFQQAEPPPASSQLYPRRNPSSYDGRSGSHYHQNYRYQY